MIAIKDFLKQAVRPFLNILWLLPLVFISGAGPIPPGVPQVLPQASVGPEGGLTFSLPVELPPGTRKIQPDLGLAYSSSGGDGMIGVGWQLYGLPYISRNLASGIRYDAGDTFAHSEVGSLVLVDGGQRFYHSKSESFLRFQAQGSCGNGPCSWTVRDREGNTYHYGSTDSSRIEALGRGGSVRVWALARMEDPYGNFYSVEYDEVQGAFYPTRIAYANREIYFSYSGRSRLHPDFSSGSEVREERLLSEIEIRAGGNLLRSYRLSYTYAASGKPRLTTWSRGGNNDHGSEDYEDIVLQYSDKPDYAPASFGQNGIPSEHVLRLPMDPNVCAIGNASCVCVAAALLGMPCPGDQASIAAICQAYTEISGFCAEGYPMLQQTWMPADINGDGRTDLVRILGDQLHNNLSLHPVLLTESGATNASPSPALPMNHLSFFNAGDVNGDGRTDFFLGIGNRLHVYFSNGSGIGGAVAMNSSVFVEPNLTLDAGQPYRANQFTADINGDGRSDFVRFLQPPGAPNTLREAHISLSNGNDFDAPVGFSMPHESPEFQRFVDMDGDGRAEYVRIIGNSMVVTRFHLGSSSVTHASYPIPNNDKGVDRNRWLVDLNGDGRPDFARFNSGAGVLTRALFTGTGFQEIAALNVPGANVDKGQFGDVDGDGFADFIADSGSGTGFWMGDGTFFFRGDVRIWSATDQRPADCHTVAQAYLVHNQACSSDLLKIVQNWVGGDINGDGLSDILTLTKDAPHNLTVYFQPAAPHRDLLVSVGSGNERRLDFEYSLAMDEPGAVNAGSAAYPDVPAQSPRRLVKRITRQDGYIRTPGGFAPNLSRTLYSYSDGRYYRSTNDESKSLGFARITALDEVHGDREEAYYNQTAALAGTLREKVVFHANGNVLRREQYTHDVDSPFGTDLLRRRSETIKKYQGGSLISTVTKSTDYDGYGNPRRISETAGGVTVTTDITSETDLANWIPGRSVETEITSGGKLISRERLTYNGFQIETRSLYDDSTGQWVSNRTEYDARGNVSALIDRAGNRNTVEHDSDAHAYVTRRTNALGYSQSTAYDTALGLKLSETDFNGNRTEWKYDGLGRLTEVLYPGDSGWSEKHAYHNYGDSRSGYVEIRAKDGSAGLGDYFRRQYVDGSGQVYRSEKEGYVDGNGQHNIVQETYFDTRGRVVQRTNEYMPTFESSQITTVDYLGPEGMVSRVNYPDGRSSAISYNGLTTTSTDPSGITTVLEKDERDNVIRQTRAGLTSRMEFDPAGRLTRVTGPDGAVSTVQYSSLGQRTEIDDPDSGRLRYEFDAAGRIRRQIDPRGVSLDYSYDAANRVTAVTAPVAEDSVTYTYDEAGVTNGVGRLTSATDASGTIRLGYDERGRIATTVRNIDNYAFTFQNAFDSQGRVRSITYPEGSVVENRYSDAGFLNEVLLDGRTVVRYAGPIKDGAEYKLQRLLGNGARTDITFDRVNLRVTGLQTILKSGQRAQNWSYNYDNRGNLTGVIDQEDSRRSRVYEFDNLNRITKVTGHRKNKPFTETYAYSNGGNLVQKGDRAMSYTDADHRHAVTQVDGPEGTLDYQYDAAGNMTRRGDWNLEYNSASRLSRMSDEGGVLRHTYYYDYSGQRIKTVKNTDQTTVYYIKGVSGHYELNEVPGAPKRHTIYIRGLENELVSQYTRENAQLVEASIERENQRGMLALFDGSIAGLIGYYGYRTGLRPPENGGTLARMEFALRGLALRTEAAYLYGPQRDWELRQWLPDAAALQKLLLVLTAILLAMVTFWLGYEWRRTGRDGSRPGLARLAFTPAFAYILIFSQVSCLGVITGTTGDSSDANWALLGLGVDSNTPSVADDPQNPAISGGGGAGSSATPVTGFYYFHPDHLGSISMITDAQGNHVAGVDINSGQSHISYLPYGEIDRTNSDGPDIFRYKYTAQHEDAETGLFFYNARFYDPALGRFIQPDIVSDVTDIQGMNRYMYVTGNPLRFNDPSGRSMLSAFLSGGIKSLFKGLLDWVKKTIIKNIKKAIGKVITGISKAFTKAGKWLRDKTTQAWQWLRKSFTKLRVWVVQKTLKDPMNRLFRVSAKKFAAKEAQKEFRKKIFEEGIRRMIHSHLTGEPLNVEEYLQDALVGYGMSYVLIPSVVGGADIGGMMFDMLKGRLGLGGGGGFNMQDPAAGNFIQYYICSLNAKEKSVERCGFYLGFPN